MKKHTDSKLASFLGATRAARTVALSGISLILAFALLVAANLLFGFLPMNLTKPDVTGKDTFEISKDTLKLLDELDQDVTISLVCTGGKNAVDGELLLFLSRYAEASGHVTLEVIDPAKDPDFIASHGGSQPAELSIVVESAARYKIIDNLDLFYYYLYDASYGAAMTFTPYEYATMLDQLAKEDTTGATLAWFTSSTLPYFDGESCVTNAINYVTLDRVATACVLNSGASTALDAGLTAYLADASFDVSEIAALDELPDSCDVLVIHSVQADLSEDTAKILSSYLATGGKLFLATSFDKTSLPNLASVLKPYGLGLPENAEVVCEGHTNYLLNASSPLLFAAHMNANHRFSSELDGTFVVYGAHSITLTETEGVALTPWLTTSAVGYLMDPTTGKQIDAPKTTYTVGAIAEKGETQIVWISSSASFHSQINTNYASNGNFDLFLQALNHLSGVASDSIAIPARVMESPALAASPVQLIVLGVILVLILPIATAAIGIGIWYVRKKR